MLKNNPWNNFVSILKNLYNVAENEYLAHTKKLLQTCYYFSKKLLYTPSITGINGTSLNSLSV